MRPSLIALDHKQPEAPLKTKSSTTEGFVKLGMKPKRSKIWDIIFHWLRDKELLYHLRVYWYKRVNNDADYYTKHHLPIYHRQMRLCYVHTSNLARKPPRPSDYARVYLT